MSGPDRIWAFDYDLQDNDGTWSNWQCWSEAHPKPLNATEYIRRDPAVLAALPEVQALIAGAYEAAAKLALPEERGSQVDPTEFAAGCRHNGLRLNAAIRALTPADAIAARDAMIAEAESLALDVTTLHRVISDIRAATVGGKPMLSDLAQALVAWRDEAVAKEREACAELAASSTVPSQTAMRLSAAIRKRGEG